MPKSRGRQRKNRRTPSRPGRAHPAQIDPEIDLEMVRLMQATDEAEARGDAAAALRIMASRPLDSDGELFWRPGRVRRLQQLIALEGLLPRWATSRWLLAQAQQMLGSRSRPIMTKSLRVACDLRELLAPGATVDQVKIIDHDWVFRQAYLYEYGGLALFLRTTAAPDLVAGADRIHDWARAPMRALRLVGRSTGALHWRDLATEETVDVLDLGAGTTIETGEYALGRVVPVEGGVMFEALPLRVPEEVAVDVALDPAGWIDALRRGCGVDRPEDDEITTAIVLDEPMLTDVPDLLLHFVVLSHAGRWPHDIPTADGLTDEVAAFVRAAIDSRLDVDPEGVDPWPCIAAALVQPPVLDRLASILTGADRPALAALADRLAGPAADLCRRLADARHEAA